MPAVDMNSLGRGGDRPAIEVDVDAAGPNALEQDLHELDPLRRLPRLRLPSVKVADRPVGRVFPRLVYLNALRECERFAAARASEQPSTPAPRAIHLTWGRDQCVLFGASTVAYQVVVRLP